MKLRSRACAALVLCGIGCAAGTVAPTSRATVLQTTAPICQQLTQLSQGRDAMRHFHGDAVVLEYGEAFRDHEEVRRRLVGLASGEPRIEPFSVFEVHLLGHSRFERRSMQALAPEALRALAPYVARGSIDALLVDDHVVIALADSLASHFGVTVGDRVLYRLVRERPAGEEAPSGAAPSEPTVSAEVGALLHFPAGALTSLDFYAVAVSRTHSREVAGAVPEVTGLTITWRDVELAARHLPGLRAAINDSRLRLLAFDELNRDHMQDLEQARSLCAETQTPTSGVRPGS
jgi:hypothetical protein